MVCRYASSESCCASIEHIWRPPQLIPLSAIPSLTLYTPLLYFTVGGEDDPRARFSFWGTAEDCFLLHFYHSASSILGPNPLVARGHHRYANISTRGHPRYANISRFEMAIYPRGLAMEPKMLGLNILLGKPWCYGRDSNTRFLFFYSPASRTACIGAPVVRF